MKNESGKCFFLDFFRLLFRDIYYQLKCEFCFKKNRTACTVYGKWKIVYLNNAESNLQSSQRWQNLDVLSNIVVLSVF
jgi:hypothetical protein